MIQYNKSFFILKFFIFFLTGLVCVLLCFRRNHWNEQGTPEKPKLFRVAHVYGQNELVHKAVERFAEQVEKESGGLIDVRFYPSGQLGKERETFEGLRLHSIDMMIAGSSIFGWYTPEYAVVDVPFLFRDYEHIRKVWQSETGTEIRRVMKERTGAEILELWFRGPRYLTASSKIIRSPEDLHGFKLRVPEFEIYLKSWQAFGANVTPIPVTDLLMALKFGVVDGQENPLATIYGNSLHEVQKYIMRTEHLLGLFSVCIDQSFYNRFTKQEQILIFNVVRDTTDWYNSELLVAEKEYERKLKESGVVFIDINRETFRSLAREKIPPLFKDRWAKDILQRINEIK
ncbi:MAG: TRAP transporter substrate-binding protein [Planctomycetaceae bacterium]|jgi:tripartite ATP-independent transporter DctP family solute receptor|nr:TRAP transporter substrate-binding protein [Planctomycetaceae bacterium]